MLILLLIAIISATELHEKNLYDRFKQTIERKIKEVTNFDSTRLAKLSNLTALETVALLFRKPELAREAENLLFIERAKPALLADAFPGRAKALKEMLDDWTKSKLTCIAALDGLTIKKPVKQKMISSMIKAIAAREPKLKRLHNFNIFEYAEQDFLRMEALNKVEIADKSHSLSEYIEATTATDRYLALTSQSFWKYAKAMWEDARDKAMFLGLFVILVGTCLRFATVDVFWFAVTLSAGSLLCAISAGLQVWIRSRSLP